MSHPSFARIENPQLYDHTTDRGKRENIAADHPETVAKMREKIQEILDARKAR